MFNVVQPRDGEVQQRVIRSGTGDIFLNQLRHRLPKNLLLRSLLRRLQHQVNQMSDTLEDPIEVLLLLLKHWTNS